MESIVERFKAWQIDYAWSVEYPEFRKERFWKDVEKVLGTSGVSALKQILSENRVNLEFK